MDPMTAHFHLCCYLHLFSGIAGLSMASLSLPKKNNAIVSYSNFMDYLWMKHKQKNRHKSVVCSVGLSLQKIQTVCSRRDQNTVENSPKCCWDMFSIVHLQWYLEENVHGFSRYSTNTTMKPKPPCLLQPSFRQAHEQNFMWKYMSCVNLLHYIWASQYRNQGKLPIKRGPGNICWNGVCP